MSEEMISLQDSRVGQELFLRSSIRIENAVIRSLTGIQRRGGFQYYKDISETTNNGRIEFFTFEQQEYLILISEQYVSISKVEEKGKKGNAVTVITLTEFTSKLPDDLNETNPRPKNTQKPINFTDIDSINIGYTQKSFVMVSKDFHPLKLYLVNDIWRLEDIQFYFPSSGNPYTDVSRRKKFYEFYKDRIGYPKYIANINSRLVLAGTDKLPNVIWFSLVDSDDKEGNLFTIIHNPKQKVKQKVKQQEKKDSQGDPVLDGRGQPVYEDVIGKDGKPEYEDVIDKDGNPVLEPLDPGQRATESNSRIPSGSSSDPYPIQRYLKDALYNMEITGLIASTNLYVFTNVGIVMTNNIYTNIDLSFNLANRINLGKNIRPFLMENDLYFFVEDTLNRHQYIRANDKFTVEHVSSYFRFEEPYRIDVINQRDNIIPNIIFTLNKDKSVLNAFFMVSQYLEDYSPKSTICATEWTSEINFIDIQTDLNGNTFLLGKDKSGKAVIFRYNEDALLDESVVYENTRLGSGFTGYDGHLDFQNGETLGIVADGLWEGENFTVTNGKINEEIHRSQDKKLVEVGRPFYFKIEKALPYSSFNPSVSFREVNFLLSKTASLDIRYKGDNDQIIKKTMPMPLDKAPKRAILQRKTKTIKNGSFGGTKGMDSDDVLADITFTIFQESPLYVNILSVEYVYEV